MALWLVRAGKYGGREQLALDEGRAIIGWEQLPDLSAVKSRDDLKQVFDKIHPDISEGRRNNWVAQVWAFRSKIKKGDLVVLPSKHQPTVAVGKVTGDYEYQKVGGDEPLHSRRVQWLNTEIPRNHFGQDLLYSLGAFMTVCQIKRNDAENRVLRMLEGKPDRVAPEAKAISPSGDDTDEEAGAGVNLETVALDQIRAHLERNFKGHRLAELVHALLEAQGFNAYAAPPGPDYGVDVIASKGPLGFEPPRLVVQVKSQDTPLERSVVTELQGAMRNFRAERGMVVSWGGYKRSVEQERARLYFEMRLWNADDLIKAIQRHYDDLPDAIQADLPMKRIWVLVPEGNESG